MKRLDRHLWTIDQSTEQKRAGEFSWCCCGALRWRRLDNGAWHYLYPTIYAGCQAARPNPLRRAK